MSGTTLGKLLSVIPGIANGVSLFFDSGIYVGGYYTTDYTDTMIVIAVSKNKGTYYPAITLKDSESGYNWNNVGTFIVLNPQEGKTYKYFRIKIV